MRWLQPSYHYPFIQRSVFVHVEWIFKHFFMILQMRTCLLYIFFIVQKNMNCNIYWFLFDVLYLSINRINFCYWFIIKLFYMCETCEALLHFVFLPHPTNWKGGFKGWCLNTSGTPSCLTARWDFFYSDLTERQTGSVWAAGEEKEAPSQWESADLLSHSWGPIISHQSLSTTETWLQRALAPSLCMKEKSSIRGRNAFLPD